MAKKRVPKKKTPATSKPPATETTDTLRQPAEIQYGQQIESLKQVDKDARPENWSMSPRSVLRYIVGGGSVKAKLNGKAVDVPITKKFFGDESIVERAIVTLASERALLLVGEPGTGKSWISEHLAAAISGDSTLTVQGTAGTTEEHIKYSWNIARLISEGPTADNLIPSPTMLAMKRGALLRFEEITRCVPDVQDSLVSILSDKAIAIPELPESNMLWAKPGFNVIATANTRDQGVNELSAALKRRFNYIHIPIVSDKKTEMQIVQQRSSELLERYSLPTKIPEPVIDLLTTVFREIRDGRSKEGVGLKKPNNTLSTAEAIGVALESALRSDFFGKGEIDGGDIGRNLIGSVVKEDLADIEVLKEYAVLVAKKRAAKDKGWAAFYGALSEATQK